MTSEHPARDVEEELEPQDGPVAAEAELAAHDEERFFTRPAPARAARLGFAALVVAILLVHAVIIAAFLWRDAHDKTQVAAETETPVEVVEEPPPEQPPPPPPPPPPEQKKPPPKEDLSPALSAPRAPNDTKADTQKTQPKTAAPSTTSPPQDAQPQPKPQTAQPKEQAPAEAKQDEAAKEEDKSKPDAEALDKAKPKIAKESKTKEAKAAPKHKQKPSDLIASLSAPAFSPDMSFAKPTPKTRVYGGTEDVRWLAEVEGMLEDKVGKLPKTPHWQAGGHVVVFFHVDVSGRVISRELVVKSGYPDIDAIAMRALAAAAPFPPPPPGIEHGLVWSSVFDGQLPTVHVDKR